MVQGCKLSDQTRPSAREKIPDHFYFLLVSNNVGADIWRRSPFVRGNGDVLALEHFRQLGEGLRLATTGYSTGRSVKKSAVLPLEA